MASHANGTKYWTKQMCGLETKKMCEMVVVAPSYSMKTSKHDGKSDVFIIKEKSKLT